VVELRSSTLRQPFGGGVGGRNSKVMPRGRMVYILLKVTMWVQRSMELV